MKVITYYCSTPLLDFSIEQIKEISSKVILDVVILVSKNQRNSSILNLKSKIKNFGVFDFIELKNDIVNYEVLNVYFENCRSVKIVYFADNRLKNISIYRKLFKQISQKHEISHFDDISGIGLIVLLRFCQKKIILNIHDPVPHSGEFSFRNKIIKRIAFFFTDSFIVFSQFSFELFRKTYQNKSNVHKMSLTPYFFYSASTNKILIEKVGGRINLLFFGRISPYKGLTELIVAFQKVRLIYPNIHLIIAGKGDLSSVNASSLPGIEFRNYFINLVEMSNLFRTSDVLICPYKDATQSGVLMTAKAFNLPHIVSNVGALPENTSFPELIYDINSENGLEKTIINFIEDLETFKKIKIEDEANLARENTFKLIRLYNSL